MPTQTTTPFTSFEFTNEELYTATRYSALQLMLIQTLYSKAAMERLSLTVDVDKPQEFVQHESCLKGTMEAYEHLILLYTDTVVPNAEIAKQSADVNPNLKGDTK